MELCCNEGTTFVYFSRLCLAHFTLRKKRDDATPTTNTDKQREHHKDNIKHTQTTKSPRNNPNHITKELAGNDGACHPPPWRPPKRTTLCLTPWRLPKLAYAGRGIPRHEGHHHRCPQGPYNTVKEAANAVHNLHIPSIGPSHDLPLLDLKIEQSDHRMPNGVVLAPWRTLRKGNHLQT
jgi:hypothetical protein